MCEQGNTTGQIVHAYFLRVDAKIRGMSPLTAPILVSKRNPTINRLAKGDAPIHRWYRFVLSFPAHVVREYIDEFKQENESFVLDPFCGTGTALVESKKNDKPSIGIESHPMTHFASGVKTTWNIGPEDFRKEANAIATDASKEIKYKGELLTLSTEQSELLLKDSICPMPLHQLIVLRNVICENASLKIRDHLLLALAKTAVAKASNLHFGPEVGVRGRKESVDVIAGWLEDIEDMSNDLEEFNGYSTAPTHIIRGDSREPDFGHITENNKIGLVITSPPYPNEKDYTRTTRLESVLLGFINNRDQLREVKRGLIRSNTRTIYKGDDDRLAIEHLVKIKTLAEVIENRRKELGKTSGFEKQYHKVVLEYFGGMARHLAALRPHLKKGAHLAYVVGDQASFFRVMIRTGDILKEIALELGYEHVRTDLFRERISTATGDFLREEVLILKWSK